MGSLGTGDPLQCSCLENPRDGGGWWAAIYGVTQSRTRLKRLSSSRNRGCKPERTYKVGFENHYRIHLIPNSIWPGLAWPRSLMSLHFWGSCYCLGSQSWSLEASSILSGNLLGMQILRHHPRPAESETGGR